MSRESGFRRGYAPPETPLRRPWIHDEREYHAATPRGGRPPVAVRPRSRRRSTLRYGRLRAPARGAEPGRDPTFRAGDHRQGHRAEHLARAHGGALDLPEGVPPGDEPVAAE